MGRGILSGLIWGSIISVVVLGAMSQLSAIDASRAKSENASEQGEKLASADSEAVGPEMVDGGEGVSPLMESPEAEATPEPAAEPPAAEAAADAAKESPSTAVELPAGSEFRKAPAETEAELPEGAVAPDVVGAPDAPARGTEDVVALLPQDSAPRPDAPGMEVAAPNAPDAETGGAATTAPAQETAPETSSGPALPQAASGEAAPDSEIGKGFPPPQSATTPESAAATQAAAQMETFADATADSPDTPEGLEAEAQNMAGETPEAESIATGTSKRDEVTAAEAVAPKAEKEAAASGAAIEQAYAPVVQAPEVSVLTPSAGGAFATATQGDALEANETEAALAPSSQVETPQATAGDDAVVSAPVVASDAPLAGGAFADGSATKAPATEAKGIVKPVQPLTERAGSSSRLPQIGVSVEDDEEMAMAEAAPTDELAESDAPKLGMLARNARPFENPEGKPLLSVILIYDGEGELDRSVLGTFSFPVTFAIDPSLPDAQAAGEEFAKAGFEVVALASDLPEGATARDMETTLESHLARLPQAVAVMDPAEGGIAGNRDLVEQVLTMAAQDGYGLIGWSRGLGPLEAASRKGDNSVALVYRELDAGDESNPTIRRYLDRAAFKAAQDGSVILVGHSRSETVTALFSWALGSKSGQVALAPVSAILRQQ